MFLVSIFDGCLIFNKINACGHNFIQIEFPGGVFISVTAKTVLGQDKFYIPIFIAEKIAAGAAHGAFKWELDAVPMRFPFKYKGRVAVRTESFIGVDQPCALLVRSIDRFDKIFPKLVGSLDLFLCQSWQEPPTAIKPTTKWGSRSVSLGTDAIGNIARIGNAIERASPYFSGKRSAAAYIPRHHIFCPVFNKKHHVGRILCVLYS